ncbi:core-binding factor subunit beta-like isoform X2 [Halichondria panicea]|uniref:core-binding factor subunit beta-like isoform X2 n=1 Tax=Halichondria panicea TaxID=6063 RepID=UPI00312B99E1
MPRVVPDQKNKFETDELFKKLAQDMDVKYTGYRDRQPEDRKKKFIEDLNEGISSITFVATGTNLCLQFCPHALNDDKPKDMSLPSENVSFDLENHKVNMSSRFIMNGVCIKWVGWIDLDTLVGKARLIFDEEQARVEDEIMRAVMKETQERVRMFEENQRRWQEQHHLSSPPPLQQATALSNQ